MFAVQKTISEVAIEGAISGQDGIGYLGGVRY